MKNRYTYIISIFAFLSYNCSLVNGQTDLINENFLFIVSKDKKYGILNSNEEIVIPLKYSFLLKNNKRDAFFIASISKGKDLNSIDYWGGITINDQILIPFDYSSLTRAYNNETLFIGKQKDENGIEYHTIYNERGIKQFPLITQKIKYFNKEFAIISNEFGQYLVDSTGRRLSQTYDNIHSLSNGMIRVDKNDLTGFLDSKCIETIKPQFYFFGTHDFGRNGIAKVRKKNEWEEAYINTSGKIIFDIGANYRYLGETKQGICAAYTVSEEGTSEFDHCIFNFNSAEIIKCFGPMQVNANFEAFSDNIAFWGIPIGEKQYKFWVIDLTGKVLYNATFDDYATGNDELIITIMKNGDLQKYGLLSKSGKYQVNNKFDGIEILQHQSTDDIIVAKKDNKYGFIDEKGAILHDFEIEQITQLKNGELVIVKNKETFLYSQNRQTLIAPKNLKIFDYCPSQPNCYVVQNTNGKFGVFDFTRERWEIKPIYDSILPLGETKTSR